MCSQRFRCFTLLLGLVIVGLPIACSDADLDDPREVVIALFGAMEKNDEARLAHILDLPSLMRNTEEDYALAGGQPRVFTNPQDILKDLTHDGETKRRWFQFQRIVNKAVVTDDVASVEVTFVDKDSSRGYMTNFGLRKTNDKWRIYSFKTLKDSP